MTARFLTIAKDPSIIPGVHHYCDEWCDYCPVARRCLAFRCTAEFRRLHRRREGESTFVSIEQAVAFTRELSALDGSSTRELDNIMANPSGQSGLHTVDPLASVAWEYAVGAAFLLTPAMLSELSELSGRRRESGPAPAEVVLWHHLRIYMKVVRALIALERVIATGCASEEPGGCVKLVLVSLDRSRAALRSLRTPANAGEVARLITALDDLERGLEQRVPEARAYVRFGIDCPVA